MKFSKLLGEFENFFAWSYEDICGFDLGLIHHAIPIKEGMKLVRQNQRLVNPAWETTIRQKLEKTLKVGISSPVKYPEWVSKLVHVPKVTDHIIFCINFLTFN